MLGAIVGDIIGSTYEFESCKNKGISLFPEGSRFTDDSVLTCAVAQAMLEKPRPAARDYARLLRSIGLAYPGSGYGARFVRWLSGDTPGPYGSYGNGSAMRVSPVAWISDSEAEILDAARESAMPSHDHPEGVKGAQATALAIFMARKGEQKERIKDEIETRFGYDLSRRLDDIRPIYDFDETCQKTVPEAIIAFLESADFEDAIRNAVSLGGDADTLAAIAGPIAEAFYGGVPDGLLLPALHILDAELYAIAERFTERFVEPSRPGETDRLRRLRSRALADPPLPELRSSFDE